MRARSVLPCLVAAVASAVVGCADDDDSAESSDGTAQETSTSVAAEEPPDGGTEATSTTAGEESPTGPSPGVTDESIKVGVTHVDTEALVAVGLNYDLGDHEAVYQALFDDINASGGIHGRMIEPVYAPIDPTQLAPAEEACVRLTEDEDVFVVVGFFLTDSVLCPLEVHETAVVGGGMTPERIERAAAPWATWLPDTDHTLSIIEALAERGDLDGPIAVFANVRDEVEVNDVVVPKLQELGIEPVEVGIADVPPGDTAANDAAISVIAQRFAAAGAEKVVIVAESGQDWPTYQTDDTSYRPQLVFLDQTAVEAFASNEATTDTSILEGAVAGGAYGQDQAIFDSAAMQECVAVLEAAGIEVPAPETVGDDPSNQPYQAAFQACPDVALLRTWLETAGEAPNYGALTAALEEGFEIELPVDPTPRIYGPPPDADGNPAAYIYRWDESARLLVLDE